jgi:hypothetical protein
MINVNQNFGPALAMNFKLLTRAFIHTPENAKRSEFANIHVNIGQQAPSRHDVSFGLKLLRRCYDAHEVVSIGNIVTYCHLTSNVLNPKVTRYARECNQRNVEGRDPEKGRGDIFLTHSLLSVEAV